MSKSDSWPPGSLPRDKAFEDACSSYCECIQAAASLKEVRESGDSFGLEPGVMAISDSYDDHDAAERRVWRLMCAAVLTGFLLPFIEDVNGALRHVDVNMDDWSDRAFVPGLGISRHDNLGRVILFQIGDFEKWKKDLPVGATPGPVERCWAVLRLALSRLRLGAEKLIKAFPGANAPSASKQPDDLTQAAPEVQSETPPAAAPDEPMAANPAQATPAAQPEAAPPVTQPNNSTIDIQVSAPPQCAPEAHSENLPPDKQQPAEPPVDTQASAPALSAPEVRSENPPPPGKQPDDSTAGTQVPAFAQGALEGRPEQSLSPAAQPNGPTVVDPRSREQVLTDYFKDCHDANKHPTQGEADEVLKAAGKSWDRKSFRKRFNELARTRGVNVGRGVRGNRH
jgi:hypothetical protein